VELYRDFNPLFPFGEPFSVREQQDKTKRKSMSNLRETLVGELKDLYDAEKQIVKALPKMIKAAEHEELKEAFESHLQETQEQISRLEKVFQILGEQSRSKKCKGMEGLLAEGADLIEEKEGDAALICAAQKVEHYEMAAYGSLVAWASLLDEQEVTELFEETLQEEEQTDQRLTELAETIINADEVGQEDVDEEETAHKEKGE
jgi:ferritin-like metal-binding protein YciE